MNWYINAILAGTLLLAGCGGGGGSNTVNTITGVSAVNAFPNLSGAQVVSNREIVNVVGLTSFGEDNGGELYAVSGSGEIFRFEE
jgi:hypothetical protein